MIPILIGSALYSGIGLVVRHYYYPREPAYMAAVWPIGFFMGGSK